MPLSVKVSYNSSLHRFTLPRSPSFLSLCEALVQNLCLPTKAPHLADPSNAPFTLWFLDDERDYCRLFDDLSLREALRLSPHVLRLRIQQALPTPLSMDLENLPVIAPAPGAKNDPITSPPQFSSTTLLKLLSHLRNQGTSHVKETLETLYDLVRRHERDPPALRELRHDIASLMSNFLARELGPASEGRIRGEASVALQKALRDMLRDARVSKATTEAAVRAVRAVSGCRAACDIIRTRYSVLVNSVVVKPMKNQRQKERDRGTDNGRASSKDDIVRPVKHYMNQFIRLMRVAGKEAQEAYEEFAVAKREAEERGVKLQLTRRLCKGIQRASFHFLRFHVTEGKEFEIETRAITSLASAVCRKLRKVGYDEQVLQYVYKLVFALAMDHEVLRLAYEWANKPDKPVEIPVDDEKDLPEVGHEAQEWGDWHEMVQQAVNGENKKKSKKGKKKSPPRDDTRASRSEASDRRRHGSSRRHSRHSRHEDEEEDGDSVESDGSSGSLESMREEDWHQAYGFHREGGRHSNIVSPMHSSEERWHRRDDGHYASDVPKSSDTQKSQWARVQMGKDKEAEEMRVRQNQIARERQMERERLLEIQLAKQRRQDMELERQPDGHRYSSYRHSYGHSGGEFSSRNRLNASRGASMYTGRSHHTGSGWRQEYDPREGHGEYLHQPFEEDPGFADERMEDLRFRHDSGRRSLRSMRNRIRNSFSGRGSRHDGRYEQYRGASLPTRWRASHEYVHGDRDWVPR